MYGWSHCIMGVHQYHREFISLAFVLHNTPYDFIKFMPKNKLPFWTRLNNFAYANNSLSYKQITIILHLPSNVTQICFIVHNTFEPLHQKTNVQSAYAKTKAQTSFANRAADQRLCFCYTDSTIPLLHKTSSY